jgi:hypothetical protein
MKVHFLDKSYLLYAYSILKPLAQIQSGKVKTFNMDGSTIILVEKLRTTPEYNPALNTYEVI